jgi:PAS domain S-box-containing protein
MDIFTLITPVTYALLIVLWCLILFYIVREYRSLGDIQGPTRILIGVLAIDAARTLFESVYFGSWYSARVGFFPNWLFELLVQPQYVFVPKAINVISALLILALLVRRWLPELDRVAKKQTKQIASLKESELRFRLLSDAAFEGISFSRQGIVLDANHAFSQIFGYETGEIIGKGVKELIAPDHLLRVMEYIQSNYESPYEVDGLRKDGSRINLEIRGKQIRIGDDVKRVTALRDITKRKRAEEVLKESEKKFLRLFMEVSIPLCFVNINGVLVHINDRFTRLLGYTSSDIPTLDEWWTKAYPDITYRQWALEAWTSAFQQAKEQKTDIAPTEYNVTCKNGKILTIMVGGVMFGDDFLATFIDITNRKKAEKKILSLNSDLEILNKTLEENVEKKTRERDNFFNLSNDLLLTASADGYFKDVNPAMLRVLGWSTEELTEFPFFHFIHPDDVRRTKSEYEQQLKDGKKTVDFVNRYRCKDGSYRWIDWNATAEPDGTIYASARDVTEQKAHEENIKKLHKQNELILNSAGEGIYGVDLDGITTFINPAAAEMLGWKVEDLLGKPQHETVHHHYHDGRPYLKNDCPVFISFEDAQVYHIENEVFWRKDGSSFPVQYVTKPIVDEGKITGAVITFRDVTEHKRMEESILKERAKSMAAESASQAKSTFLATMSHDIRTPMNAILGMGEILAESGLGEEQSHSLNILTRAGTNLLALINDILDLSKIEAGQLQMEAISFDLYDLVDGTHQILFQKAHAQGTLLSSTIQANCPKLVIGDPQRLQQILINLLGNAIKFTEKGKVTLTVAHHDVDRIQFAVSDTGIGIPKKQLENILEPFQQAENSTTRRFGGTGLGLSICSQLVQAMDGKIEVESELGKGSVFSFTAYLPEPEEPLVDEKTILVNIEGKEDVIPGQAVLETAKNILLVDDAEDNLMVISAFLKSTPHRVTEAVNGEEAVLAVKSEIFDLILMDMQMPILDGFGATETIRDWEKNNNKLRTPIIALTANAMREDIEKTETAGCDLHLTKPIRKARLMEVIGTFPKKP